MSDLIKTDESKGTREEHEKIIKLHLSLVEKICELEVYIKHWMTYTGVAVFLEEDIIDMITSEDLSQMSILWMNTRLSGVCRNFLGEYYEDRNDEKLAMNYYIDAVKYNLNPLAADNIINGRFEYNNEHNAAANEILFNNNHPKALAEQYFSRTDEKKIDEKIIEFVRRRNIYAPSHEIFEILSEAYFKNPEMNKVLHHNIDRMTQYGDITKQQACIMIRDEVDRANLSSSAKNSIYDIMDQEL